MTDTSVPLHWFDDEEPVRCPVVDVVLPVHNEDAVLRASVRRLHAYLTSNLTAQTVGGVTVYDLTSGA